MMRHRRGFTLIEAMVTMAITGIIAAAAASAMSLVLRTVATTRNNVTVNTNLNNSLQFISRDIESAGGQGLPGQSAIIVENDAGAGGTDRVHVFMAMPEPPVCTVRPGETTGALSFQYVQGGCCFPAAPPHAPSIVTGPVMLSKTNGSFRPVLATGIAGTACEFQVQNLLDDDFYLNDPVPTANEGVPLTDFTPFLGGQATLVTLRTYYVSKGVGGDGVPFSELRAINGAGASATDALIMDEIWDFQIALGVDANSNGIVADNEWAYRGTIGVASDPYVLRRFPPRLVNVAIVQGLKATGGGNAVTVPLRTGNQSMAEPTRHFRSGMVQLVPINATLGVLQ